MLASGLALGVIAGFIFGRDWRPLLDLRVRLLPVLVGSLALRAIAPFTGPLAYPSYLAAIAGTAIAAAFNLNLVGARFVVAGAILNLIVIAANGAMPVDATAVAVAGAQMPSDALHVPLTAASKLPFLADVIPVALVRGVYSAGDFSIALGAFLVPFIVLARR
jgi:hypothetical protein